MPHSHSTPAGVDGGSRTPPTTPRKAGKMLAVRVQMLDDTITMFQVQVIRNGSAKYTACFCNWCDISGNDCRTSIKSYIGFVSRLTRSKSVVVVI